MKSADVRKSFLKYFEKNNHTVVPSSRLVPENDATLLFTNAGMNQFKNTFLGFEKRPYTRATSSQKCVRAGGKHNDLEQVGLTARHHTFFEMLGNFSFGDYFKKEAIHFAWEFLTKELGLPKEKLYITVFETDDEAADIWHKQEGIPREKIIRYGEKDNFWRMGDTGPCGPCSEIFYDHGPENGNGNKNAKFGEDDARYVEIWNLVFMQFFEEAPGKMNPLPKPSVDTGAGLERLSAVLQGVYMNYDTDLFQPLIQKACKISKKKYYADDETDTALRVLADHARACAFLIGDGVLPSNEGRGYVLRRILRRAARFGRKLSIEQSVLLPVVEEVIATMSDAYPDLTQQKNLILKTISNEEVSFLQTLDQGTEILNNEIAALKKSKKKTLSGDFVFKLYDTFGFPMDLTRMMGAEQNILIDESGFEAKMDEARKKSQASWKGSQIGTDQGHLIELSQKTKPTEFVGYTTLQSSSQVLALSDGKTVVQKLESGQNGFMISDRTPFYAEGGGQVGDQGLAQNKTSEIQILDTTKINNVFFHQIHINKGSLKINDELQMSVHASLRRNTQANHTATHLLHAALRKVLGTHVTQAGSLVDANRTRFDFTHDKPLTHEERQQIEKLVNEQIELSHELHPAIMPYKKAIEIGAMALFGEKYGDEVRVLKIGDFSTELCGGTHVSNASQIRVFKIISETGVSRGVRRIEAITSTQALNYLMKDHEELLSSKEAAQIQMDHSLPQWIETKKKEHKELERSLQSLKSQGLDPDFYIKNGKKFSDGTFVFVRLDTDDRKVLSDFTDKIQDKLQSGIVLAVGEGASGCPIIVNVSKNISQKYNAGKILGDVAKALGGKGGGRSDFAQGSAPSLHDLDKVKETLFSQL